MEDLKNGSCESGESSSSINDFLPGDVITEQMIQEEKLLQENAIREEKALKEKMMQEEEKAGEEQCYKRLNLLLSRSSIYTKFIAEKLKRDELKEAKRQLRAEKNKKDVKPDGKNEKRKKVVQNSSRKKFAPLTVVEAFNNKSSPLGGPNNNDENEAICNKFLPENITENQPALLTGGVMHPYQIRGVDWLKALFENGVNGILADEMGLGKTIQCIAFIAYLIEMNVTGPFFVCGPLSTVPNWYAEFKKFAPSIPVVIYHGLKDERKIMRSKILKSTKIGNKSSFPVFITSYQIALADAKLLCQYPWKLLVIDEAHRIKNFQCKLVAALKLFTTSHRLLLTGTPLQNNLAELWSLLNFILPEIFDDLKVFESWFDITRLTQNGGTDEIIYKEQEKQIVSIIHQILTPFLLRRTKADVNLKIPPKKEIIVHAPLTKLQQEYYTAVLNKTILNRIGETKGKYFDVEVDINSGRSKRNKQVDFKALYKQFDDNAFEDIPETLKSLRVSVNPKSEICQVLSDNNVNVRNICMLLRKICGHPYLVSFPLDITTGGHKIDEDFIKNSGKLLLLDLMLPELKKRGHKILLFSQFVTMLEILEDYCIYRGYKYNFLCGRDTLDERREEIKDFSESEDSFIFLISTKAGGLGLNLAAADTVIIYDSDWNPQTDLQAQDRSHRIGQSKPVVVYRLVIPNTIDEKIIDRAAAKRKLEKVIIKKGRFTLKGTEQPDKLGADELLELLQSSDLSGFVKTDNNCVLSPEELSKILDRSDMTECI